MYIVMIELHRNTPYTYIIAKRNVSVLEQHMSFIENRFQLYLLSITAFLSITTSILIWVAFHPEGSNTFPVQATSSSMSVPTAVQCKDCNIVIMTLDSCSAKNIPCYGYNRNTMPNLCKFASEHVLFTNSFSNATWTLPSHVSLMTGLLPSHHQVDDEWKDALDKKIPLLPEVLQQNGYETILYQDPNAGILPADLVYNRGITEINGQYTIDTLMDRLELNASKGKKSFFTYYNSICHEPNRVGSKNNVYTKDSFPEIPVEKEGSAVHFTPEYFSYLKEILPKRLDNNEYNNETPKLRKLFEQMRNAATFELAEQIYKNTSHTVHYSILDTLYWSYIYDRYIDVKNKKMMDYLRALYDQQILELDAAEISQFINRLRTSKVKDSTIVIITAEHGQEFGEHGVFGHSTLYDGNLQVPFVLSVPGIQSLTITKPVQSVDIMPTLLDVVGIRHSIRFDGQSLVPLLVNAQFSDRILVAEWAAGITKALRKGDWKLFVRLKDGEYIPYELYNIKNDPGESFNILVSNFPVANTIIDEAKLLHKLDTPYP